MARPTIEQKYLQAIRDHAVQMARLHEGITRLHETVSERLAGIDQRSLNHNTPAMLRRIENVQEDLRTMDSDLLHAWRMSIEIAAWGLEGQNPPEDPQDRTLPAMYRGDL